MARFAAEWTSLATPLGERAVALLHFGAATLAVGAIAGLYYAASRSDIAPVGQARSSMRRTSGASCASCWLWCVVDGDCDSRCRASAYDRRRHTENAARWIHLYAGTILLVVIVPRAALAIGAWIAERRQQLAFPIALADPYFQGLLRGWRQGTAQIAALAYSYDVPKVNAEGVVKLMTRALQSTVDVQWLPVTAYGDDLPALPASLSAVVVVFNLAATPERETHGAFARALAAARTGAAPVVTLVDTSDFVERFGGEPRRITERQDTWQRTLAAAGFDPVFARLANPDLARDGAALAARLVRT
jgi:hypothetical protein